MADIETAIDVVYDAFANLARPSLVEACDCCLTDGQRRQLVSVPLRQIDPSCMSAYGSAVGRSSEQFRYYLPRHLDIAATDTDGWCPEPETIGRTIHDMGREFWSDSQTTAVEDLFRVLIHKSLHPDRHHRIDPWLCCIAHAGFPVHQHLHAIAKCKSAVVAYFSENPKVVDRKLCNRFWEVPNAGYDDIVNWFHSKQIRDILYSEFHLTW